MPWRDLQPGDFLQMWYPGGGGHSAVFIDWVRQGRRIVGLRYWSTHPALGGIGYREERFGEGGPSKALLYGARLWQPDGDSARWRRWASGVSCLVEQRIELVRVPALRPVRLLVEDKVLRADLAIGACIGQDDSCLLARRTRARRQPAVEVELQPLRGLRGSTHDVDQRLSTVLRCGRIALHCSLECSKAAEVDRIHRCVEILNEESNVFVVR